MSVTAATLSAIQQAGQAIDAARQALALTVQDHGQQMMAAVASQPFGVDNDKLFAHWKTVARLAQEVHAMEEQLKTVYQTAATLVAPEVTVLTALPHAASRTGASRRRAESEASRGEGGQVEDVQVKPGQPAHAARPSRSPARGGATETGAAALSANDAKVLDFLQGQLDRRSWTALSQGRIADGAGIPRGSIGVAMRRLIQARRVLQGQKGRYRLG